MRLANIEFPCVLQYQQEDTPYVTYEKVENESSLNRRVEQLFKINFDVSKFRILVDSGIRMKASVHIEADHGPL